MFIQSYSPLHGQPCCWGKAAIENDYKLCVISLFFSWFYNREVCSSNWQQVWVWSLVGWNKLEENQVQQQCQAIAVFFLAFRLEHCHFWSLRPLFSPFWSHFGHQLLDLGTEMSCLDLVFSSISATRLFRRKRVLLAENCWDYTWALVGSSLSLVVVKIVVHIDLH